MRTLLPLHPPHRLALTARWTVPALLLAAACATAAPAAGPASPAPGAALAPRRGGVPLPFAVPGSGRIELVIPEGWVLDAPAEKYALNLRLGSIDGAVQVMITAVAPPGGAVPLAKLRSGTKEQARQLQENAAEKALAVEERAGPAARLAYVSATDRRWVDRAPPEGEFRHVTAGGATAGDLILSFTILSGGRDAPERARALDLVASARHLPAGAGPQTIRVTAGGRTVSASLPGFAVERITALKGGRGTMVMGSLGAGWNATLAVDAAAGAAGPEALRDQQWKERIAPTPLEKTEVERATRGGLATVSYLIPRYRDLEVRQRHAHGFLVRDGTMAEVHVSKVRFEPADAARIDETLRSARLE